MSTATLASAAEHLVAALPGPGLKRARRGAGPEAVVGPRTPSSCPPRSSAHSPPTSCSSCSTARSSPRRARGRARLRDRRAASGDRARRVSVRATASARTCAEGDASGLLSDPQDAAFFEISDGTAPFGWLVRSGTPPPTAGSLPEPGAAVDGRLRRIHNVEMALTVEIGRTRMAVRDVLLARAGADRRAGPLGRGARRRAAQRSPDRPRRGRGRRPGLRGPHHPHPRHRRGPELNGHRSSSACASSCPWPPCSASCGSLHRKLRHGRGGAGAGARRRRRQSVGQKASVVVVDTDGKRFLLGVTEHGINVLHTSDVPQPVTRDPHHAAVPGDGLLPPTVTRRSLRHASFESRARAAAPRGRCRHRPRHRALLIQPRPPAPDGATRSSRAAGLRFRRRAGHLAPRGGGAARPVGARDTLAGVVPFAGRRHVRRTARALPPWRLPWLAGVLLVLVASHEPRCDAADGAQADPDARAGDGGIEHQINTPDNAPSSAVVTLIGITLLSVAPALLLMMTSFTKIFVVLAMTRNALALPSIPPNQVLAGLALFLSLFIMAPVLTDVNTDARAALPRRRH